MLWFLRTLPLAVAVGIAVGMSAAYLKASRQIAALESRLAGTDAQYACAAMVTAAEERGARRVRFEPAARVMLAVASNLPAARAFAPPPPAAAPAPCPSPAATVRPAAAPPLPFTYLGRMVDAEGLQVFLARGNDSHIARAGGKIGQYRVDQMSDSSITFTHIPSKTRQILHIPAVSE